MTCKMIFDSVIIMSVRVRIHAHNHAPTCGGLLIMCAQICLLIHTLFIGRLRECLCLCICGYSLELMGAYTRSRTHGELY